MRVDKNTPATYLQALCLIVIAILFNACDSSIDAEEQSLAFHYPDSFKPNDKEYPYADIPRIVIETENHQAIKDIETEIPAKMQIWGNEESESEIMDLTIRGRGNSSWSMPQKSYKIEFDKKQSILGMPKDKDWALIANYADKSLIRNYIAYQLSRDLDTYYAPRCEFVELYVNQEYLGVYLLTETIKIGENRVNIPKDDKSYIIEFDEKYRDNEQVFFSDILLNNGVGKAFRIHYPKTADEATYETIKDHVQEFENTLIQNQKNLDEWIDIEESIKHYWAQEFTKNPDAGFYTSVYFTWIKEELIKMGPVWDFDLAFGNHSNDDINRSDMWLIRSKYWYNYFFKNEMYVNRIHQYWVQKHDLFTSVLDSIDSKKKSLDKAAKNNFSRWNILQDTTSTLWKNKPYSSYDEAIKDLKDWLSKRIEWIDKQKN